jgi:hypothetical protein
VVVVVVGVSFKRPLFTYIHSMAAAAWVFVCVLHLEFVTMLQVRKVVQHKESTPIVDLKVGLVVVLTETKT